MRFVLQRSFRRSRQPFNVATACSPSQWILAWVLATLLGDQRVVCEPLAVAVTE